jgi:hypothetical protein
MRISLYRHLKSEPQPKLTTERLAKQFRKPNLRVRKYLILWHLKQYIACSMWFNTLHYDPMPLSKTQLGTLLENLNASTPSEFLITFLESADYIDHNAVHEIHQNVSRILESLVENPGCSGEANQWIHKTMVRTYAGQIRHSYTSQQDYNSVLNMQRLKN